MPTIRTDRESINALLDSNRFSLGEMAIVVTEGATSNIYRDIDLSYFNASFEILEVELPKIFSNVDNGIPTILRAIDDGSICPSSITFVTCGDSVSLPIFEIENVRQEIEQLLSEIPKEGSDEFPETQELEDEVWSSLSVKYKQRALSWLSAYLSREVNGDYPASHFCLGSRLDGDEATGCQIVVTSPNSDRNSSVYCWTSYWDALEDHDGPYNHTEWKHGSTVEVVSQDHSSGTVDFNFVDDEGYESFRTSKENFDSLWNKLSEWGWAFIDKSGSSIDANSGNTHGETVVVSTTEDRKNLQGPISPTPHVRPTQQRAGASVNSGIVQGDVNVSGLSQVNGIVQGDINVPSGADVNVNGIVQGIVRVNGGTARLYGTIAGATISSGRLEVYGILQTPLKYTSGEVYYDPNSLIAK